MSNGADRFFDEMLETAKKVARKDVANEQRKIKADLVKVRRDLKAAQKAVTGVAGREAACTRRETAVKRREGTIATKCTRAEQHLKYRETDIKLAEKEIISLLNQIEAVKNEKVETVTTTARRFVTRSTGRGWYGRKVASTKAEALSNIKRRVNSLAKKEAKDE